MKYLKIQLISITIYILMVVLSVLMAWLLKANFYDMAAIVVMAVLSSYIANDAVYGRETWDEKVER